jgi:hypothetical protein
MLGRPLAFVAVVLGLALAVSGCNASAWSKRELVVHFDPAATSAQRQGALEACDGVTARATPEPYSTTGPASNQASNVRYRIDHANDRDIALLTTCLSKQPGVVGAAIPDVAN